MANVDTLHTAGMIRDKDDLSDDLETFLNALNATEVQQLIDMWDRQNNPDPNNYSEDDLNMVP